jgi:predicted PurR-regulated permease PerM
MNRSQAFLLLCIGLSAAVSLVVIRPFLQYVLGAIIASYVLHPAHRRLVPHLGPSLSPILLILVSLVVVILPLLYIVRAFIDDLQQLAAGETELQIEQVEATILEYTGEEVDVAEQIQLFVGNLIDVLFGSAADIATAGLKLSLGFVLVLFLVYYLLKDGARFVAWSRTVIPLPSAVTDGLFDRIDRTTWGVVIGHISVALIQSVIAGVGLYFAGIPNVVFWTFVMAVLALLPLIGAFLVWGPAALYLAFVGDVTAGVLLAVYGFAVVSMVDNYARPIVIDQRAQLNPGVILVGVFGGVYTIGFTGLFVGPIVLGVFAATLRTFKREYDRL